MIKVINKQQIQAINCNLISDLLLIIIFYIFNRYIYC